ncbi:MAG: sulfatase-like hydrolase/transferase, partial [Caldilineaceae bacterium]|nr:sulfatase-like hydrolase/transferase [Caldilineaceae bacterium]
SPYSQEHHLPELTARYAAAAFDEIPPYNSHPWVKNEDSPGESPPVHPLRDRYIGYYAAVTELDTNIGRILDKLAEQGRLDNTLVIYTSDHGCALGHHGFWGKGNSTRPLNMYDTSLRVPLIWRGPGITGGQVVRRCVDHYATFRTVLEMAGVTPDPERNHPGLSYGDLLRGESEVWNDNLYGEYGDLRMLRTPDWKLVWRYPDGPHDLFDLLHDPEESVNLALDAKHQPLLADLKTRLDLFYAIHANPDKMGLAVKSLPRHNRTAEAWRDGRREARGLQIYS